MADEPLTAAQAASFTALVDAQASARDRIQMRVVQAVRAILAQLAGRWYDEAAVREAAAQLGEVVRSAQVVTGDVTSAYLDQVYDLIGVDPPTRPVALPDRLRNVDPGVEWSRPARDYRRVRLAGLDDFEASERARQRAETMAKADLNLAMREAARQRMASVDAITGYRRVVHPERSRTGTCGLCLVASDRIYRKADLLPIHDGDCCEVLPIVVGKPDPGRSLNAAELKALYAAGGGTDRTSLTRLRIRTVEHGELGPILVDAGHRFRDHKDVVADTHDTAEPVSA